MTPQWFQVVCFPNPWVQCFSCSCEACVLLVVTTFLRSEYAPTVPHLFCCCKNCLTAVEYLLILRGAILIRTHDGPKNPYKTPILTQHIGSCILWYPRNSIFAPRNVVGGSSRRVHSIRSPSRCITAEITPH